MATFAGSRSMRENYASGVDGYYASHGASYRNPHWLGICQATAQIMDVWVKAVLQRAHPEVEDTLQHFPRLGCHPRAVSHLAAAVTQPTSTVAHHPPAEELDNQGAFLASSSAVQDSVHDDDDGQASPESESKPADGHHDDVQHSDEAHQATEPNIPPPCHSHEAGSCIRVLDLACGSGEASQAVAAWWYAATDTQPPATTLPALSRHHLQPQQLGGPTDKHSNCEQSSQQPSIPVSSSHNGEQQETCHHDQVVQAAPHQEPGQGTIPEQPPCSRLQLCIDAADPYTAAACRMWTGRTAEDYSFQDVGAGHLTDLGRSYHVCICSYAMHVLDTSFLFATLQQLSLVCETLIIISPHKLPKVDEATGWTLVEHLVAERVHARLYESTSLLHADALCLVPSDA